MAVTFTSAKALLVAEATALSAEATAVGLSDLATALTNLASEIGAATPTESEFFGSETIGGAAYAWGQMLTTSASIISAKNSTTLSNEIAPDDSTTLKNIFADIPQAIENIETQQRAMLDLASGSGIHMLGPMEWMGLISTYRLYVEIEGPEKMTLEQFKAYYDKINSLPKSF